MSKIGLISILRNLVLAVLLTGMAVGLLACPENGVAYSTTQNGSGDHSSGGGGSGDGMGGGTY